MLHFVALRNYMDTVGNFLAEWAPALARTVRLLPYEELFQLSHAPAGAWIFADADRLPVAARELAASICAQLRAAGNDPRSLLNDPNLTMGRFELLSLLAREGANRFRVFSLADGVAHDYRFPVFVRRANDHGIASELLTSVAEVRRAVSAMRWRGVPLRDLIAVELCDTADTAGIYRKYSYMRVGADVFPAHLCFGTRWSVHWTEPRVAAQVSEEHAFFAHTTHAPEVRRIFERARIDFGRIDYSLLDGALQVWEINANPTLAAPATTYSEEALALHARVTERVAAAWQQLSDLPVGGRVALKKEPLLRARARVAMNEMRARTLWGTAVAGVERRYRAASGSGLR